LVPPDDRPRLVQIREPLPAIISWYEYDLKMAARRGQPGEDSPRAWQDFAAEKIDFYRRFVRRWVESGETANKVIIWYEDYMDAPFETLAKVIAFFDPDRPIDRDRLAEVAGKVRPKRDVKRFRYLDQTPSFDLDDVGSAGTDL
jgi:hypothetical protein